MLRRRNAEAANFTQVERGGDSSACGIPASSYRVKSIAAGRSAHADTDESSS